MLWILKIFIILKNKFFMKIKQRKIWIIIILFYIKKYFKFTYILFFFFGYFLYFLSLEKCYDGFDICSINTKWIKHKINEVLLSCVIIVILIELIFYKIISALNFFHLVLFYIIVFAYSHGIDFDDHGYYNFYGSIALIISLISIISPINVLLYIIKLNDRIYLYLSLFVLLLLITLSIYILFTNYYMNCDDWKFGLNNSYIENDLNKYSCKIIFPKICPYKIGKYFFDKSKQNANNCPQSIGTKKKLLKFSNKKYVNINTTRFGYPLPKMNKFIHQGFKDNSPYIRNFFKNNIIDMDNHTLVHLFYKETFPELIVNYNRNIFGELIVEVRCNETLSKERKLLEQKTSPYSDNIIVLYIDSVSRSYSIRGLKKTMKFVEQFMQFKGSHNNNFSSDNYHSFQFFKYHAFNYYTRFNYPPIFYGKIKGKLERNIKFLKENGYVTCTINDFCHIEPTDTGHNMTNEEIPDHEMIICEPNMKRVFSTTKRCLYNKITADYAFDYGNQFWRKYLNNRKYLSITLEDGHEGTLEVLKYTDKSVYNFLNNLYNDNLFKKTSIFIISDHGTQAPSLYHLYNFYHIERFLPMFYLICNDRKNISYQDQYLNIYNNQQVLITGYDIYNTIVNLVYGDNYYLTENKTSNFSIIRSKFGISLFEEINPKKRNPKKYKYMTNEICVGN